MRKKVTVALLILVCALTCVWGAACDGNPPTPPDGHTHDYQWVDNGDGTHKQHCSVSGCDTPDKNVGSHDFASGNCVCGKQKPAIQSMNVNFDKARAVYSANKILDENGVEQDFDEMLDRQFDVLAKDILYRLYIVYGENTYDYVGNDSPFGDFDLQYVYNGNSSKVEKHKILCNLPEHTGNHKIVHEITLDNVDCPYCYQMAINGSDNHFRSIRYINIQNAINGMNNAWNSEYRAISSVEPEKSKWLWNDYEKWYTQYKDVFKSDLAKMVYGDENSNLGYPELLRKIDCLGFGSEIESKIINYIYNHIIGASLVEQNLRIYNTFTEDDKQHIKIWLDDETDKHLFKGYNVLIPTIVRQALANTFDGTVSLYPTVCRYVNSVSEFDTLKTERNYKQIVLMPKTSDIRVTEIHAKFFSDHHQNKTVTVKATVKNALGKLVTEKVVGTVILTAAGTPAELNIDCSDTIGIYDGDTTSYDMAALFGNNTDEVNLGNNYVEFTFEYDAGVTFGIDFIGIYDK